MNVSHSYPCECTGIPLVVIKFYFLHSFFKYHTSLEKNVFFLRVIQSSNASSFVKTTPSHLLLRKK